MSTVERNFDTSFMFKGGQKANTYETNLSLELTDFFFPDDEPVPLIRDAWHPRIQEQSG